MMGDNNYSDFELHKVKHDMMINKVEEVLSEYERNPDTAMSNAAEFLRDWLIKHINGTDKEYSRYLIDKGVK